MRLPTKPFAADDEESRYQKKSISISDQSPEEGGNGGSIETIA